MTRDEGCMIVGINSAPGRGARKSSTRISPCEAKVLELATLPRPVIAEVLGISENTVKAHLRSLFVKAGAETRAQLVVWRERRAA